MMTAMQGCQAPGNTVNSLDDAQITTQLKLAIMNEAIFNANQIRVETFNGVVQLSGNVATRLEALHVEEMAKTIKGVKEIKDNLEVK